MAMFRIPFEAVMPLWEDYAGFLRVNEKARRKLKDCGSTFDPEGKFRL